MLRLEHSEALGRVIRKDDVEELGVSTWDRLREAIRAGKKEEALALVDYAQDEGKAVHDVFTDWSFADLTYVAENFGEEQIYKMLRFAAEKIRLATQQRTAGKVTFEDIIYLQAEAMRAHSSGPNNSGTFKVEDKGDHVLMTFDPCGSGGRMRRLGRSREPVNLGRTKRAYPWSWGKKNVPYYCLHCNVWSETMPIEARGFPRRINLYDDDDSRPCRWAFYKKPEDIPEEYYERLGLKKVPSRWQKRSEGKL